MNELVTMNEYKHLFGKSRITIKEPEAYYIMHSLHSGLQSGLAFLCNEFNRNSFYVIIRYIYIFIRYIIRYISISAYSTQMFLCSLLLRGYGGEACTGHTKSQPFADDLQKNCSE